MKRLFLFLLFVAFTGCGITNHLSAMRSDKTNTEYEDLQQAIHLSLKDQHEKELVQDVVERLEEEFGFCHTECFCCTSCCSQPLSNRARAIFCVALCQIFPKISPNWKGRYGFDPAMVLVRLHNHHQRNICGNWALAQEVVRRFLQRHPLNESFDIIVKHMYQLYLDLPRMERHERKERKKPRRKVKKKKEKERVCLEGDCAVCRESLDDKKIGILKCGHSFCVECLEGLKRHDNTKCPICHADIDFEKDGEITYGLFEDLKAENEKEKKLAEKKRSKFSEGQNDRLIRDRRAREREAGAMRDRLRRMVEGEEGGIFSEAEVGRIPDSVRPPRMRIVRMWHHRRPVNVTQIRNNVRYELNRRLGYSRGPQRGLTFEEECIFCLLLLKICQRISSDWPREHGLSPMLILWQSLRLQFGDRIRNISGGFEGLSDIINHIGRRLDGYDIRGTLRTMSAEFLRAHPILQCARDIVFYLTAKKRELEQENPEVFFV